MHANFIGGCLAGALNGMILNPLAAIRYHCWGEANPVLLDAARRMWRKSGTRGRPISPSRVRVRVRFRVRFGTWRPLNLCHMHNA